VSDGADEDIEQVMRVTSHKMALFLEARIIGVISPKNCPTYSSTSQFMRRPPLLASCDISQWNAGFSALKRIKSSRISRSFVGHPPREVPPIVLDTGCRIAH